MFFFNNEYYNDNKHVLIYFFNVGPTKEDIFV